MNRPFGLTALVPASTVASTVASTLAFLLVVWSSPCRADVSSWFFTGGGPSWLSEQKSNYDMVPSLQFDLGLGTTPSRSLVVGVLSRTTTHFGRGTDLALAVRATTGGFSRGGWGLALDAGLYKRWWGRESWGPTTSLHLGAPYGLQLTMNGALGTHDHRTLGIMVGIDLLRLTIHRPANDNWWRNPRPSWRPDSDQ